ncbi:hypothetical protein JCM5353_001148 [Sporobolomyces roseus]
MVIAQNVVGSLEEDTYHGEVSPGLARGDPAPDVVEHTNPGEWEVESPLFADGRISLVLEIDGNMVEEDSQVAILMKAHQYSNGVLHSADHAAWWLEGTWSADFTIRSGGSVSGLAPLRESLESDDFCADEPCGSMEAGIGSVANIAQYCAEDGSLKIDYFIRGKHDASHRYDQTYDSTGHLLFDNPDFCDVAFKVQDSYILAVKALLIQRSSYFKSLFESGFSESSNIVLVDPNELLLNHPRPPIGNSDDDDMTPFESEQTYPLELDTNRQKEPGLDNERPTKRAKRDLVDSHSHSTAPPSRQKPMLVVDVPDANYYTYRAIVGYLHCHLILFTTSPSLYHAFSPDSLQLNGNDLERRNSRKTVASTRAAWLSSRYDALSNYVPPEKLWPASPHAVYRLADRYDLDGVKRLAKNRILNDLDYTTAAYELFSPLSLAFPDVQAAVFDYVCSNFDDVKKSLAFRLVLDKLHSGELASARDLTERLFLAVLEMQTSNS